MSDENFALGKKRRANRSSAMESSGGLEDAQFRRFHETFHHKDELALRPQSF
jgi:hypothetical protein